MAVNEEALKAEEAARAAAWARRILPVRQAFGEYRAAVRTQLLAFRTTGVADDLRSKLTRVVEERLKTLNRAIDEEMKTEGADHGGE